MPGRDLVGERQRALERLRASEAALDRERFRPVRPGDLFALSETASWPVEWVVVGPDRAAPERLVVLPADGSPLAGSGDVEAAGAPLVGPLVVRCRHPVSLPPEVLDRSRRSGLLAPDDLAVVTERWQRLAAETLAASEEEDEVDASADYGEWIAEVVEPAREALAAAGARRPPAGRWRWAARERYRPLLPLAAAVLLAVGSVLGVALALQGRRLAEVEARLAAAASAAHLVAPVSNLDFAWLHPETDRTRGATPPSGVVTPAGPLVALILSVPDPGAFRRFRLEVLREDVQQVVWSRDDLVLTGPAEASLGLPRELLPPGDYVLRLSGVDADAPATPLATYRLRVGSAGAAGPRQSP